MRSSINTKKRRNKVFKPQQRTFPIVEQSLDDLEPTLEHNILINSGRDITPIKGEYTNENQIKASDVPVPSGSYITDYDGIMQTLNQETIAYLGVKRRLEWAATVLRQLEVSLHEKDILLAKFQGFPPPKPLPYVKYFDSLPDEETASGVFVLSHVGAIEQMHKKLSDRNLMVMITVVLVVFFLFLIVK